MKPHNTFIRHRHSMLSLLKILCISCSIIVCQAVFAQEHGQGTHQDAGETSGQECPDNCAHEETVEAPGHEGHDHDEHEEAGEAPGHEGHDHDEHEEAGEAPGHEGHDHDEHEEAGEAPGHEGHDHDEHEEAGEAPGHEGHDHDEHEEVITFSTQESAEFGIELSVAGPGWLAKQAVLPGSVIINDDHLAHIVPRAPGIVRKVEKVLGDHVQKGEILAWIESAELAESKLDFYMKATELGCCEIKLTRTREIFENIGKLLELLDKEAPQKELDKLDELEMGEYRGQLLTAYAEYLAAREIFEREKRLRSREISSDQALLEAQTAFKTTRATFLAAKDTARYETMFAHGETVQERQVAEFEAVSAEKRLRLKGADDAMVQKLRGLVPKKVELTPCLCGDPNCGKHKQASVSETLGKDIRFAWYALRAPFDGQIIEKHITRGEKLGDDSETFTIADMDTVWVDFNIYQKDLPFILPGLPIVISGGKGFTDITGTIDYVSPIINEETRTALARVILPNPEGTLRPGLFVTGFVTTGEELCQVVVPRDAVQALHDQNVVFVKTQQGFKPVAVTLGKKNATHVEVLAGLSPAQRYVSRGAFELKAEMITSTLDSHAGHGH